MGAGWPPTSTDGSASPCRRIAMEILLTNTYSHRNKGDLGIVQGILSSFWTLDDAITFNLVSLHPEGDRRAYTDPRVNVIQAPFHGPTDDEPLTGRIVHWLQQGLWRLPRTLGSSDGTGGPPEVRGFLRAARRSDVALACGGGYLHDSFGPALYIQLAQLWLADREGLPLYLLPQSIGPASGLHRRALASTLRRAEHVYVREPVSFDYVERLNLEVALDLAPDAAFALESDPTERARSQIEELGAERERLVGFTVRQWHFPGTEGDPEHLYERYLRSYGRLISERPATTFAFLPQVTGPGDDDDRIALQDLVDVMDWGQLPANVVTLDPQLSPGEIIAVVGEMDAFVGTRMHSNIFALCARVPTFAISYLPKTDGIMAMLDLEDWVLDIGEVTAERLASGYQRLVDERETYRERLEEKMPAIEDEARSPARRILEREPPQPVVRA